MPAETPAADPAAAMLAELKHTISLGPDAAANAAQRLHRVVEAVLDYCRAHGNVPGVFINSDVPIPPSEIRRVISRELLGEET